MSRGAKVAVVTGQDAAERVERALALLGGLKQFVSPGDTVFIKPNFVFAQGPPQTTDPQTVACLVREAVKAGAKRVLVGDAPSSGEKKASGLTSREVIRRLGLDLAVREAGGEEVALDEEEIIPRDVPEAVIYRQAKYYKWFVEADVVIGVPVMKTHFLTGVTLGIKCLYGLVALEDRKKNHRDDLHQKLVDILKFRKPDLTVIDAGLGMEGMGPKAGDRVVMDMTLAGADIVATDAVACSIMGFDPKEIDHIRLADFEGLGTADLSKIEVLGAKIEDVRRPFKPADLRLTGIYPGVTVVVGGVCRECRARIRWALDELHKEGLLEKVTPLTVIAGVAPYLPWERIATENTWIVGECACKTYREAGAGFAQVFELPTCPADTLPRVAPGWARKRLEQESTRQ